MLNSTLQAYCVLCSSCTHRSSCSNMASTVSTIGRIPGKRIRVATQFAHLQHCHALCASAVPPATVRRVVHSCLRIWLWCTASNEWYYGTCMTYLGSKCRLKKSCSLVARLRWGDTAPFRRHGTRSWQDRFRSVRRKCRQRTLHRQNGHRQGSNMTRLQQV